MLRVKIFTINIQIESGEVVQETLDRVADTVNAFIEEKGEKVKKIMTAHWFIVIVYEEPGKQKLPYPAYGKKAKNKTEDSKKEG